ncbi:hypothetical protein KIN20_021378 [Parelaphostrongylus tenuis]|uniref:Uncharacterized protein n=1 Tax=Parelaphostrongylus tenuis TaxID=148309 RepID=A0AAD5MNT8_PARTN|nr:hypothetical protein KIN20_021378 [Parelaphostrongylus tenuis]
MPPCGSHTSSSLRVGKSTTTTTTTSTTTGTTSTPLCTTTGSRRRKGQPVETKNRRGQRTEVIIQIRGAFTTWLLCNMPNNVE